MRAIVFGGSGFLGSHVCDKLSDAGYDVAIFDCNSSMWRRRNQEMIVGDILDSSAVRRAVTTADIVYNFAGIADIDYANLRPVDTVRSNILGNATILDACREVGIKRYVFASSVYVYSKSGGFYRCSKQCCELYIESYHKEYGIEYTILRYGSLYGTRSDRRNAIHRFVTEALMNKKIRYDGSPEALREYIHVEDAALSSVEILKSEYANQKIILTGHQTMKVGNLLKMIAEIIGQDIGFEFGCHTNDPHYEITPYSFSPVLAKKLTPVLHIDLGQGILQVIEDVYRDLKPEAHGLHGYRFNSGE